MTNENYLIHYGVKGMKWGVKQSRAVAKGAKDAVDSAKGANTRARTNRQVRANEEVKKSIADIDSAELQRRVNRMNLEQQYTRLTTQDVSHGRDRVGTILDYSGAALGIVTAGLGAALAIKTLAGK